MFTKKTEGMFAKGAIHTRPWRVVLAGAIVACAFGGIALQFAWATPGAGISTTILAGPSLLEEGKIKAESEINKVELEFEGFTDMYVVHNRIVPGGHTGWHSHPGPSIITVRAGTASEYHGDDDDPHVHAAGTSFLEPANTVHLLRNEGTTDLELVAVQFLPAGATRRIDARDPTLP